MILDGEFGYLVGMKNNHIAKIPLADVAGKLKMIQPDDEMVQEAKAHGNFIWRLIVNGIYSIIPQMASCPI